MGDPPNVPIPPVHEEVNARIDRVIRENAAKERELRLLLMFLFLVGVAILIWGAYTHERWLVGLCVGVNGLITLPIFRLERLHRRTLALAVIPQITALLAPRDAAREIHALISRLLE